MDETLTTGNRPGDGRYVKGIAGETDPSYAHPFVQTWRAVMPGARVDQINEAEELPAGIVQVDLLGSAIRGRDLQAPIAKAHRAACA